MDKLGANPANSSPLTPLGFLESAATVSATAPPSSRHRLHLGYEAHFGVPMSGAVLNSINTRLDARTVSVLLRHSGSKLILVDPALLLVFHDALRLLPPGHPALRIVLVEDPTRRSSLGASGGSAYERLLETGPSNLRTQPPR
ncbi:hypothetical protein QYE76_052175 [Lolium multiflorum]|uniref:Uncharacterized protein n=1 Tax=Lolium multiflorum TaxID=4521 RepID=A0AAD8WJ95_LOLMU|nr:hypothetical protein QYE76_052175 [Lolium multiflorum]